MKVSLPLVTLLLLFGGAGAQAMERTVSVSGEGEVQAEPDRATVMLGVESRKPKLDDARAEVSKTVDALLKLTRDLKIDQKYVRATRLSVQPEYNWNNNTQERNLIGYYVSRQVEIDLRDLEKLGVLLERAVNAGANQVGDAQLDSTRRREFQRQALANAVGDARLNAEAIAKAAGGRAGTVRTISASSSVSAPPTPMMNGKVMAMAVAGGNQGQNYQSGQMTFTASVQAEFDLTLDAAK